jgi:hypothetical protein
MTRWRFDVLAALDEIGAGTPAKVAKPTKVEGLANGYSVSVAAKVTKAAKVASDFQRTSFGHSLTATGKPGFDGIFPDFDHVVAALLKGESPKERAHNDRLAAADGWNPPMAVSISCKVLPAVTKPAVDPDLEFVRSALTANIFAASRARGLTFRMDADGDLVIQGKGLTERDRLLFEPHETAIVEALNP